MLYVWKTSVRPSTVTQNQRLNDLPDFHEIWYGTDNKMKVKYNKYRPVKMRYYRMCVTVKYKSVTI